ncbi:hypothetical protein RCL1_001677 [Eukaryota sp. TZLM3-RCL]
MSSDPNPNYSIAPEYFYDGPYRFVRPYQYLFRARVKEAWFGLTLSELYLKQFCTVRSQCTREELLEKIKSKDILVNGQPSTEDYVIKSGDSISSSILRIEFGVLNIDPIILQDNSNFLIVLKPPSLPVSSTGPYHFNTLFQFMMTKFPNTQLLLCHRLDSVTSGVIIYAKSSEMARKSSLSHQKRLIRKVYLARTRGTFDNDQIGRPFLINEPLAQSTDRVGIKMTKSDTGKVAFSVVVPLVTSLPRLEGEELRANYSCFFNGNEHVYTPKSVIKSDSIVAVYPVTGRKHQIRAHLLSIGHPVVNDVIYNPELENCEKTRENVAARPICLHSWRYKEVNGLFDVESPLPFWVSEIKQVLDSFQAEVLWDYDLSLLSFS